MRSVLCVLLVMLGWCVPVMAQEEPIGFKAVKLGVSLAEFQLAFPDFECRSGGPCTFNLERNCLRKIVGPPEGALCSSRNTWAGVPVVRMFAAFENSRLKHVVVTFRPEQFEHIAAAARERWGPPVHSESESIQNRAGAKFTNQVMRWERGGVGLLLSRYASRVDEGSATIVAVADVEKHMRARRDAEKQGAKDL